MTAQRRRTELVLSTAKIEDFDRWWNAFSTKGAEKRRQHGSKGSQVFRDPDDDRRVLVVFDWDEEGFRNFVSDPEMAAIFEEGGIQGKPQAAEFVREHDA
jgi:heme-degrading monooxygenase HmoA